MMPTPLTPQALLSREDAAKALNANGFPTTSKSLATLATRGGGPIYRSFGRRVLYRWEDVIAWAEGRLSKPRTSTSEADAADRRRMRSSMKA